MKFYKGQIPWNKGRKMIHSGSFKKGHLVPTKWREIVSSSNKNREISEETRKRLSIANKGKTPWIKGKKHSVNTIEKLKGRIPWNKGTRSVCRPNSGSFKKGHKPKNFIGKITNDLGYVFIYSPNHPSKDKRNYVKEHRLVMEKHLGRFLNKNDIVHHINGIKNDNRIENLQLMTQGEHLLIKHPRQKTYNTEHQRMCNVCKKIKSLDKDNFYNVKKLRFGFSYTCIMCNRKICRRRRMTPQAEQQKNRDN